MQAQIHVYRAVGLQVLHRLEVRYRREPEDDSCLSPNVFLTIVNLCRERAAVERWRDAGPQPAFCFDGQLIHEVNETCLQ
jgi:hypothetical protein